MRSYNPPEHIAPDFAERTALKANMPLAKFAILAILGGAFIAFGALLAVFVVGNSPTLVAENPGLAKLLMGALFPIGLIMISVAGADLFTSDCAGVTLGRLQKKIGLDTALKILLVSYIFNFFGAQIVAYLFTVKAGLLSSAPTFDFFSAYVEAKMNQNFLTVFIKAIAANWLVCLGTWMGYAANNITGKCIVIWIPIMIFVTLGYEHSIANMFFMPAAIYSGIDLTWAAFATANLIPATLGNIVGGAVFVGCAYWYTYAHKSLT